MNVSSSDSNITSLFDLSLESSSAYAWNNVFALSGASTYSWVEYAGNLHLLGNNLAFVQGGGKVYASHPDAFKGLSGSTEGNDTLFAVTTDAGGALLTTDPAFVGPTTYDFDLSASSPAVDKGTGVPSSLASSTAGYGKLGVVARERGASDEDQWHRRPLGRRGGHRFQVPKNTEEQETGPKHHAHRPKS